ARRSTPPPPAPALLSHHVSPVSSQSSLSFGGGRGPTGGVLPSPHGPSEPVADVCPPTVSVNMKICVHHPAGSALASKKEDVVKQLRLGLLERAKRVNRLLLLENLHELKTAYDVLIPPPPPPPPALPPAAVGQRMGPGESPGRGASAFAPGELQCDCVYRRRFPMNHRLQPLDALKVLRYVNLDQFAVHGRSNTYVYRDNHRHVFYMKLSEVRRFR
ncbi:unnamed protein product, partial [Sphacelaria rigidula]